MDAHCPRMAYKSVPTANRLVTQKEVGRVLEIHTRRLASIRQRKKHVSIDDSMPDVMKLRHMSRNMKRLQQQYGAYVGACMGDGPEDGPLESFSVASRSCTGHGLTLPTDPSLVCYAV